MLWRFCLSWCRVQSLRYHQEAELELLHCSYHPLPLLSEQTNDVLHSNLVTRPVKSQSCVYGDKDTGSPQAGAAMGNDGWPSILNCVYHGEEVSGRSRNIVVQPWCVLKVNKLSIGRRALTSESNPPLDEGAVRPTEQ